MKKWMYFTCLSESFSIWSAVSFVLKRKIVWLCDLIWLYKREFEERKCYISMEVIVQVEDDTGVRIFCFLVLRGRILLPIRLMCIPSFFQVRILLPSLTLWSICFAVSKGIIISEPWKSRIKKAVFSQSWNFIILIKNSIFFHKSQLRAEMQTRYIDTPIEDEWISS
jgi:hypothetical protein